MSFPRKEGKAKLFIIPKEVELDKSEYGGISDLALVQGLEYLRNEDLVFGDLVRYEIYEIAGIWDGLVIYDGEKLVNLYQTVRGYESPHKIFQVIKNNVPLDYWDAIVGDFVWFDISPVYQELIDNITQEGKTFSTHFYYNSKKYFVKTDGDFEELSKGPILPFFRFREGNNYIPDTLYLGVWFIEDWCWMESYLENEPYKIKKFHKKANFLFEYHFSK
jgi:hypothetical protein